MRIKKNPSMGKENLKRSENKTLVHFLTNKCIHLKSHPFAKHEPVLSDRY